MALLIDVYNELVKEATEAETKEVIAARVEILDKYATLATELLGAEFPNDYNKNDVIALADKLIERDVVISEMQEKQAAAVELLGEYVQVSRDLMTQEYDKNFNDADVEKLASTLYEMDLEDEFSKEAQTIIEFAFLDELNKVAGTEFTSVDEVKEFVKDAGQVGAAVGGAISPVGAAIGAEKGKRTRSAAGSLAGMALLGGGVALATKGRISKGLDALAPEAGTYVGKAMRSTSGKESAKAFGQYLTSPGAKTYYKAVAPAVGAMAVGGAAGGALAHGKSGGNK